MGNSQFALHRLPNGLSVVMESMPHVNSAACGFLVRTGSRDEPPELAGVSHFLEHLCFKGTSRRTWEQINIEFDEMGAECNAYTGKDRTFYHSWIRTEDIHRQLDLLADMMRSTLPPEEFEIEKEVVLDEIARSQDDLVGRAYDYLYAEICENSSLAWPILGHDRTLRSITREQVKNYQQQCYAPDNMILIVAGRIEPEKIMATARLLCGDWVPGHANHVRRPPSIRTGNANQMVERFHQRVVLLAFPAPSATHELDETSEAVAAILGGINSRFYWNIVQKGLCTRAGAVREEYGDFGLLIFYALCEPENSNQILDAIRHEIRQLVTTGPEPKEIQRVKNLRRTALTVESEAPFYRLGQIADDMDYLGHPRSAEERINAVDAICDQTIAEHFRQFPITGEGFVATLGAADQAHEKSR